MNLPRVPEVFLADFFIHICHRTKVIGVRHGVNPEPTTCRDPGRDFQTTSKDPHQNPHAATTVLPDNRASDGIRSREDGYFSVADNYVC